MDRSVSFEEMVAEAKVWRHHLHQHPELAFRERQTADFVAFHLEKVGLTVHRGFGGTGVVGTYTRGTSRRSIGIRADMDGLPIQENSGVVHASRKPGVMHACGHDGHVAMALAAARVVASLEHLNGTVHFIFQPAEENEGGARRMLKEGLFHQFPCDAVFAVHNWPGLPLGTCVARDGAMMGALGIFEIAVIGRGCHGAMPHEGADPVLAACQIVTALQSVVSRNVEPSHPAVVSATRIHGGDVVNAVPGICTIHGTTRWFEERIGAVIDARIKKLPCSVAEGFGCVAEVKHEQKFPATVNDPREARVVRSVLASLDPSLKVVDAQPSMASEDFAFMLQAVPGCYVWLGAGRPDEFFGLHSSHYDFNDELLPLGISFWVSIVRRYLSC